MIYPQNDKFYMTADDETEETLILVSMLEGMCMAGLYETIDRHRSAGCGFARAARIFAASYIKAFMDQHPENTREVNGTLAILQRAILAVANDRVENELVTGDK